MDAALENPRLSLVVRPRALKHLRQFHDEVRRRFPERISQIVLFGSRARGDARQDSDYDIAVFVRQLSDRRVVDHALADIAYPHILAGIHIRPVAVPANYLEGAQRGTLGLQIARDGLVLADAEA